MPVERFELFQTLKGLFPFGLIRPHKRSLRLNSFRFYILIARGVSRDPSRGRQTKFCGDIANWTLPTQKTNCWLDSRCWDVGAEDTGFLSALTIAGRCPVLLRAGATFWQGIKPTAI